MSENNFDVEKFKQAIENVDDLDTLIELKESLEKLKAGLEKLKELMEE